MAELFSDFEVNRAPRWPLLLRLISGSVLFHTVCIACVVYVPALRDALNVAVMFSGAGYVNEEYSVAKVINLAGMESPREKFHYPPGYWAIGARINATPTPTPKPTPNPDDPKIISLWDQESKPKPNVARAPKPLPTPSPSPPPTASPAPALAQASPSPSPAQTPSDKETEEALNKTAKEAGIERPPQINKKPFVDLLAKAKQMKDKKELDLSGVIGMTIEADLNPDGTFSKIYFIKEPADPKVKELATEFMQALGASRALSFLKGANHLSMTLSLDDKTVSASVSTEMESADRAKEVANGYSGLLTIERLRKSGKDEGVIWNNTTVAPRGKEVIVSFKMARDAAGNMLKKQLPTG